MGFSAAIGRTSEAQEGDMAAEALGDGEGAAVGGKGVAGEGLAVLVAGDGEGGGDEARGPEGMAEVALVGKGGDGAAGRPVGDGGGFVSVVVGAGGVGVDEAEGEVAGGVLGETFAKRCRRFVDGDQAGG